MPSCTIHSNIGGTGVIIKRRIRISRKVFDTAYVLDAETALQDRFQSYLSLADPPLHLTHKPTTNGEDIANIISAWNHVFSNASKLEPKSKLLHVHII